jgi:hypothetical protein
VVDEGLFDVDSGKARRVLGIKFRGAEETFAELGRALLEYERKSI